MKRSKERIQRFLLDTNVFVSALKTQGKAFELLTELLEKKYDLVGNIHLVDEYVRYSEKIPSDLGRFLLMEFCAKLRVVDVPPRLVRICRPYFPAEETVDILLAGTCLQEDAVLITNDKHFRRIAKEGMVDVWSTSQAIHNLL